VRGVSTTQRRISKEVHPNLHKGDKSYLVPTTGARFQDVYDDWPAKYIEARERFLVDPQFFSSRSFVFRRLQGTPDMIQDAFTAYGSNKLLKLLHGKWRKCPSKTLGKDLFSRIKQRLGRFSKSGGSKKYAKTLKVLRRWKAIPTEEEEISLATYAMDSLLCESMLFYDSDVGKGRCPPT
jgi:hypothetical protein